MPKVSIHSFVWSSERAAYELYEPHVRDMLPMVVDSPAWFAWLESVSSFSFVGKHGHYTARQEARPRGERYWYAYLTRGRHLSKKYLGKTSDITLARLEAIAEVLSIQYEGEHDLQLPPVVPQVATIANDDGDASPQAVPSSLHPLLMTKLHIPRPPSQLVARTHLIERLRQSVQYPLTLISAPAGFGKTTLLAQWLWERGQPVAWLSLEPEDNDPARFLPYLIAALQTLDSQLGMAALALLRTPQPPPPEMVLALLVNEMLEHQGRDIVLVLDDYHVITAEPLQRGMIFLLEHLPPQLHLVLATRTDPPLPLARLRACSQLLEMRAPDLRFASDEVSTFLQVVMGLALPPEVIVALEYRTEGWIAGLQLAALSLQGRTDVSGFLTNFTGTHRFVLDYLSEEVLTRQPPAVQTFLLYTSLLDRLSGPLCDAVTGQESSQEILEMLEKANLFVVALDEMRSWYRYHHLFTEALRGHLRQREPTMVPRLHRRASEWYEQHGLPLEAAQHALAIPDEERAIRLIEPIVIPFAFRGQRSIVLGWLNTRPKAVLCAHPLLYVYYAVLLMLTNQFEAAAIHLREIEVGIGKEVSGEQARIIQGYVLASRSTIAFFSGDLSHASWLAHQALDLLPETEDMARAGVLANAARSYQISGDITQATRHAVTEAVTLIRFLNNPFATVSSIASLARLYFLQGQLQQAEATYAQVMQVIPVPEALQVTFSGPYYYFGLGDLLREWNDLEAAKRHLRQGMALIHEEVPLEAWVAIQGYTALAWLQQAQGNALQARATLDELTQLAQQRHFSAPLLAQGAAERAHLELAQGNLATAIHWAETCGLSPNDTDLPYPRESEYLTLARVHIAQKMQAPTTFSLQKVLLLLERLLKEAETKARLRSVLEILKVRTRALEAQGDQMAALATLKQALLLARPAGYVRLFVDEGPWMQTLLRRIQASGIVLEYVTTLLNAFGELQGPSHPVYAASPLAESLTEREREVLALLLEGASNREVARRLVLSVNTVKRHVYNICGKLGVQSRMQAVARARFLNLI